MDCQAPAYAVGNRGNSNGYGEVNSRAYGGIILIARYSRAYSGIIVIATVVAQYFERPA